MQQAILNIRSLPPFSFCFFRTDNPPTTGMQIPLIENLASHQGTYDTLNFTDNSLVSLGNIPFGESAKGWVKNDREDRNPLCSCSFVIAGRTTVCQSPDSVVRIAVMSRIAGSGNMSRGGMTKFFRPCALYYSIWPYRKTDSPPCFFFQPREYERYMLA